MRICCHRAHSGAGEAENLSEAERELLQGDNCSQDKAGKWARSFGGRCSGEGFMLIKWSGTPHGGGDI